MGQDVAELIVEARVCAESVGFGTQHDLRVSGLLSRLADALAALQSGTLFAGSCNAARCKFKLRPGIPSPTETVADPEPEVGNGHIPVREKLITAIIDTGLFVPGVDLTAGEIADSILDADVIPTDSRSTQRLLILRLADALERVTPRVVTTVAELEALEVGTVIRQSPDDAERVEPDDGTWEQGAVAELRRDASGRSAWFLVGHELGWRSHQVGILPATVLFTPTGKETE